MPRGTWHLITYDIRDPKRWRKAYRELRGHGERIQYSVFRVRATEKQLQELLWRVEGTLAPEDDLLVVSLCGRCNERVRTRNPPGTWDDDETFEILG